MSVRNRYSALFLLLFLVTAGWAQNPSTSREDPRLYVGLQLARAQYTVIYKPSGFPSYFYTSPWRLSAGYQLTPRLVVEMNGMYRYEGFNGSATGTTIDGQAITDYTSDKHWSSALPILARYSLTRWPSSRLHIDVLAGGTIAKTRAESSYTHTIGGQLLVDRQDVNHKTGFYYTAGLGFRYRFGYHWQAIFDWTLNRNTQHLPSATSLQVLGRKSDITYAYGLGVRYCFNLGKARQ